MSGVHFELEAQGTPHLAGDGEQPAPELEGLPSQPDSQLDVVEVWTPEEAQGALQTVMNFGAFFYGPDWLCDDNDFRRSAPNAARLLERIFPKATSGGPVGVGLDVAAVASDFGGGIAKRRALMRKGPKDAKTVMQEFGLGREQQPIAPEASAPAPAPAQPVPAGESEAPASAVFRFSPDVSAALGRASAGNVDLGALGMGL